MDSCTQRFRYAFLRPVVCDQYPEEHTPPWGMILRAGTYRYGRGLQEASVDAHPFDFVRDSDYGTAACLLIPRKLFLDLNMYDPRYAENKGAYYEVGHRCAAAAPFFFISFLALVRWET